MGAFEKFLVQSEKYSELQYDNPDRSQLIKIVDQYMNSAGYKLAAGEMGNGTYEKGDRTMRLLFGAMSKYNLLEIIIKGPNEEGKLTLELSAKSSGMSGGIPGMRQVRKEMEKVSKALAEI